MNPYEIEKSQRLLNKAAAYIGMIAEVETKSKLYKARLRSPNCTPASRKEVGVAVSQMKKDLARYSRKVEKIHEELRGYDTFSDME